MLDKPDACQSCPMYGDGKGFVPGYWPEGAILGIIAQNPGAEEEKSGMPLVGNTGRMLATVYLPLVGVDLDEVGRDNVIRCRWRPPGRKQKTNELPKGEMLSQAIGHCRQYDCTPESVRLVVAMGVAALSKFAPTLKQFEWRGHLLPEKHNG